MALISILLSDRMCAFYGEISCILPTNDAAVARFPGIHSSNSFIQIKIHLETYRAQFWSRGQLKKSGPAFKTYFYDRETSKADHKGKIYNIRITN